MMIKVIRLCSIIFLLYNASLAAWFDYDRAAYAMQQNDWKEAAGKLTKLLVHNPDRSDLLYDTGVASFNTGSFEQAQAYFQHITAMHTVDPLLKEQAHFNLANTYVELKKLPEAIEQYEHVLKLNPDNERAKHNLALVKEMLKKQEQQQQEQNKQQNNDQNQKDQKDKQQQQGQNQDNNQPDKSEQNQGQSKNQQHDNNGKENDQQKKDSNSEQQQEGASQADQSQEQANKNNQTNQSDSSQEHDNQHNQGQHNPSSLDDNKDKVEGKQSRGGGENEQGNDDTQRERADHSNQNPEHAEHQDENNNQGHHAAPSNQQEQMSETQGQHTQEATKEQEEKQEIAAADNQTHDNDAFKKLDKWLAHILQEQEKKDAEHCKQMIKATVGKKLAGQRDENCW